MRGENEKGGDISTGLRDESCPGEQRSADNSELDARAFDVAETSVDEVETLSFLSQDRVIDKDEVTVVLPVLNEEKAIGLVIDELKAKGYRNILVVDGFSTDRTVEIAKDAGATVIMQRGKGKAGALMTAYERITTPYILVMDGDYTYSASDIERFLPFAMNYDQIFGFRAKGRENISRIHRFGNWFINTYLNVLFGSSLSDVCTGMYMLKTESAMLLQLRSRGFDVEVETAIRNITNGEVTEVAISYRERLGERKLSTWKCGVQILWAILGLSFYYHPIFFLSAFASLLGIPGALILIREFYLRLSYGEAGWSIGYVWVGFLLFILGLNSFTIAALSLLIKRQKQSIIHHIKMMNRR